MSSFLCPHCHQPIRPQELEEATQAHGYSLVCPECDTPIPVLRDESIQEDLYSAKEAPDA